MNRATSIYLDLARFIAAMVVFVGHLSGARFTGGLFWQAGPFMAEAVAVFFVLSGFVIGFAVDQREQTARDYAINRAARIYSVALPALAITFALDALGRTADPALYAPWWGYVADGRLGQCLAGLFFVNQLWFAQIPQGSDLPYWSLGYEVWYYVIFGMAVFARWRVAGAVLAGLIAGPKILAMLPLWLLGLGCYRLCSRITLSAVAGLCLWLVAIGLWLCYEVWAVRHHRWLGFVPAALARPELLQDYLVGVLFAAALLGFRFASPLIGAPLLALAPPIRWAAGATFSIYLLHLPIAQFLATQMPWPPQAWATRAILMPGTLALIFAVAEVTERRKEIWRRGIAYLLPRVAPLRSEDA